MGINHRQTATARPGEQETGDVQRSRSAGSPALIIKLVYKQELAINNTGLSFSRQALQKLKRKACQTTQ